MMHEELDRTLCSHCFIWFSHNDPNDNDGNNSSHMWHTILQFYMDYLTYYFKVILKLSTILPKKKQD